MIFNGTLYFQVDDGTNGTELWKTDGTETGTTLVKDINPTGFSQPSGNFF
jgi:ELWxxDGT repeat protein